MRRNNETSHLQNLFHKYTQRREPMSIINANALHLPLASNTVQCCVTSPPYYGLRDYGTASWEGGSPNCKHTVSGWNDNLKPGVDRPERDGIKRQSCLNCGAIRIDKQIGLEPTPDAYVANLVSVFREVKRVMRDDGTLWLNLGDSYASQTKGNGGSSKKQDSNSGSLFGSHKVGMGDAKEKDLIGIPWLVAFALRADGWYLRSDIIWHKPNPMPESVTDRPTKSHEYLFLLTKNAKYYYDAQAIVEPNTEPMNRWGGEKLVANGQSSWDDGTGQSTYRDRNMRPNENGRNKRSVWTINTQPTSYAHFATFPEKLVEPCILAASKAGNLILDPFAGSGTTGRVAIRHNRKFVGTELNFKYIDEISHRRLTVNPIMI